jgi:hypothetical protein
MLLVKKTEKTKKNIQLMQERCKGLPDGFRAKNPNLGKFWRVLRWKILVYFKTIWSILHTANGNISWPVGIFCGNLVYFSPFGILDQDISGNPAVGEKLRVFCQSTLWSFFCLNKSFESKIAKFFRRKHSIKVKALDPGDELDGAHRARRHRQRLERRRQQRLDQLPEVRRDHAHLHRTHLRVPERPGAYPAKSYKFWFTNIFNYKYL